MKLTIDDVLSLEHIRGLNIEDLRRQKGIRVSTDSRTTQSGDVFFALRGEKFDGHQFLQQAFEKGASLAVVDTRADVRSIADRSLLVVPDTTKALGRLANIHRKKFSIPFIAIAGSNGKTTTKDMIATVLGKKYRVLKTEGNLNNHIGVPHTLFRLKPSHDLAVVEIGTNHFGELAYLCDVLQPTDGLITNIGREHLEFFRDLQGVAKEEGELFHSLRSAGTGYVNMDDPWIARAASKLRRKRTYGFSLYGADVRGAFRGLDGKGRATFSVKMRRKKEFTVHLAVPGKHAAANALAAAAVGLSFGVRVRSVQQALEQFIPSDKRMKIISAGGMRIIDDTYNANPDSMRVALETLQAMNCRGKKIAVLADMLELGGRSEEEHRRIGAMVSNVADYLLTYGSLAKVIYQEARVSSKFHYEEKNVLSEYLSEIVSSGDIILVKGSRAMKMEDVVTFLYERLKKHRSGASGAGRFAESG